MACLSELPDDLIRRVFHFAPVKEAASSGAISRRFRSVWRSTDTVNLEARALEDDDYHGCGNKRDYQSRFLSHCDAFVDAANAALYAADDPVRRLSLRLEARRDVTIRMFLHRSDEGWSSNDMDVVAHVLSHPKARLLEELQIILMEYSNSVSFDYEVGVSYGNGACVLSLESLPSETLRVLDLAGCQIFTFPAGVAFPRLASLRMDNCSVPLEHLQSLIFAAPTLHAVHLQCVSLGSYEEKEQGPVVRLHCPAATWLVLDKCGWPDSGLQLEIDAPRLRRFRYKGRLRQLLPCPHPPPDLARVDLHFFSSDRKDPCRDRVLFWQFLHNFSSAKELKLVVHRIEHIAVVGVAERAKLLRPFRNLERLELGGVHRPKGETAAVAIANLLRCCPVVRDLQMNLTTTNADSHKESQYVREFLQRKSRDDLQNSIQHFLRRRLVKEGEGHDDDDTDYDEVADIPALSGRSFRCLQDSLRRISLRFRPEKTSCFGKKLIKFFTENAMALEEMRIDGGNNRMSEHMNRKVERWLANSSRKRNTRLSVLPLER